MRSSFQYVIEHSKPKIVGEIGVASGDNAYDMMANYPIDYLLLVDSYIPYQDDANLQVITLQKQNENFLSVLKKFMPRQFLDKTIFSCMPSKEIVKYIPDNFFDYLYIDANHEYDNVKQDIVLWFPKVKIGGYFAGHDYRGYYDGVTRAVNAFKDKNKEQVEFIDINSLDYDWLMKKK